MANKDRVEGYGSGLPKKSKKQRRQEKERLAYTRRRILIFGGALAGLAVFGTGIHAISARSSVNRGNLADFINRAERENRGNFDSFQRSVDPFADEIVEFFTSEVGEIMGSEKTYDPAALRGSLRINRSLPFAYGIQAAFGCSNPVEKLQDYGGMTNALSKEIFINSEGAFYLKDTSGKSVINHKPYSSFAQYIIHELLHQSSPVRRTLYPFDDPGLQMRVDRMKGLYYFAIGEKDDQAGCVYGVNNQVEEACVTVATDEIMKLAGLSLALPGGIYTAWANTFRQRVINDVFRGDWRRTLKYQQLSEVDEFYSVIGQKVGVSQNKTDLVSAGRTHMQTLFSGSV